MTQNPNRPSLLGRQLLHALVARFEAERLEALATIHLYLNASAAVGDHPNVVEELATATHALATAEESLEALQRHFFSSAPTEEDGDDD